MIPNAFTLNSLATVVHFLTVKCSLPVPAQESWHPCLWLLDHMVTLIKWFIIYLFSVLVSIWSYLVKYSHMFEPPCRLILAHRRKTIPVLISGVKWYQLNILFRVPCSLGIAFSIWSQNTPPRAHFGPIYPVGSQLSIHKRLKPLAFLWLPSMEQRVHFKCNHCCFQSLSICLLPSISATTINLRCHPLTPGSPWYCLTAIQRSQAFKNS